MDTQKLFRILKNLQKDEQAFAIKSKIDDIRNKLAENTQASFDSVQTTLDTLIKSFEETSVPYSFSNTENIILHNIKGETFYGRGLINTLKSIASLKSFDSIVQLDQYRQKRNEFITKIDKIASGFSEIGIELYEPEMCEIGIVLPDNQNIVDDFEKRIKEFRIFLRAITEASGETTEELKITRISNGTFEIFSLQNIMVVEVFTTLLLNISEIWDKISKLRQKIVSNEEDKEIGTESKKEIKKTLEKEIENAKNDILEKLPEKIIKGLNKKDRKNARTDNEIKTQVKIAVNIMFQWLKIGVEVDITPIRLERVIAEQPEKYKTTEKEMRTTNLKLMDIYELPPAIKELPEAPKINMIRNKNKCRGYSPPTYTLTLFLFSGIGE